MTAAGLLALLAVAGLVDNRVHRGETLRGEATAVPENKLAKLMTFTRLFRFAAWT